MQMAKANVARLMGYDEKEKEQEQKAEKRSGTDLEGFSIKEMGAYAIDLSSSLVPILFTLKQGGR